MAHKYQYYADLAGEQTRQITGSMEDWTGFLNTMGRLYKYPFEEQLMIHAQRPDAVACAPLEVWNKPMNRYVKRGSKGIALLDNSGGMQKLKYVFDIADTEDGRQNARRPFLWELKPEHEAPVTEALKGLYDSEDFLGWESGNGRPMFGDELGDYLYGAAQSFAASYCEDNLPDIIFCTEGSFLERLDEFNRGLAFRDALTVSVAYTLMSRCGIDPGEYISNEDFQAIFDFNTPESVYALGKGVSVVSEDILREIEVTIKKYERLKTVEQEKEVQSERNNLHTERGLPDSGHSNTRSEVILGQVRDDEESLPDGTQGDAVHDVRLVREIVSPLSGDRENSQQAIRTDDGRIDGTEPAAGQGGRPDGVDGAHEQSESAGGGSDNPRVSSSLNRTETQSGIDPAPAPVPVSNDTISDEEIDTYLTTGSNFSDSKYRIFSFFLHDHTTKEKANFLKNDYGTGGRSHAFPGVDRSWESHDGKGLHFTKGSLLEPSAKVSLTWTNVANRITKMVAENRYMSEQEINRLPAYERKMLGANVLRFFNNYDNFWENAQKIGDSLDNPETLRSTLEDMRRAMENTPADDRNYNSRKEALDILTAFENGTFTLFPNLDIVLMNTPLPQIEMAETAETQANSINIQPVTPIFAPAEPFVQIPLFPAEQEQINIIREVEPVAVSVSQEDIDEALIEWNGNSDSKIRVYEYMQEHARARTAADFLKEEYGGVGDFIVTKDGAEPVTMPWAKVQRRIAQLMDEDKFLSADERTAADNALEVHMQRLINENAGKPETPESAIQPRQLIAGDEVYIRDKMYVIETISAFDVRLRDPAVAYPVFMSLFHREFDEILFRDPRNAHLLPIEQTEQAVEAARQPEVQTEQESPSWRDYQAVSAEHKDKILFYRVGDFYEVLGSDADAVAKYLDLTVIGRDLGLAERVPMVGVPAHALDGYVDRLVNEGFGVAVRHGADSVVVHEGKPQLSILEDTRQGEPRYKVAPLTHVEQISSNPRRADLIGKNESEVSYGIRDTQADRYLKTEDERYISFDTEAEAVDYAAKLNIQDTPQQDTDHGYLLSYRFLSDPDRIIVFNDTDPDEINIVARVHADGSRVILDENAPQSVIDELTAYTTDNFAGIKEAAEARIGQMIDFAMEQVRAFERQQPETQPKPQTEQAPAKPYDVGDTVYLENDRRFVIDEISELPGLRTEIKLLDPNLIIPIFRAMGLGEFEREYYRNPLNNAEPPLVESPVAAETTAIHNSTSYIDILYGYVNTLELDNRSINRLIDEIKQKVDDIRHVAGIRRPPTEEEARDADSWLRENHPILYESLQEAQVIPQTESQLEPQAPPRTRTNFRITDKNLGEGGAKTKYAMNMAAIRTLQAIESENRLATPEEQETLSRYVGWGGISQVFDPDNASWTREYTELQELLSPEEYDNARASTLNAYYTSPTVIKAMYETMERLGFKDGNLLEPSMGVGNFFGLLPESMQNVKLYGVELDSVTGRIAKQLYQQSEIKVMGFEKTDTPDSFFDAAIGNVPFGNYKVTDENGKYNKHNFNVHDFFFAKTLDQVRPGGIIAFVTSKGTLDKANPEVRKYIAQRAELLGAVRLPNNAFLKNAGTEVTSDIIFLQKRDRLIDIQPDWVHLSQTEDGIPINSYFAENPHMVLGKMSIDSGDRMYGNENTSVCVPAEGADLSEQLREALSHIQGQITEVSLDDLADEAKIRTSIPADPKVKNFSYALATKADSPDYFTGELHAGKIGEGDLYYRENSRMYLVDMPAAAMERVRGMVELRDCARELIDMQLYDYPEHEIKEQQGKLNTLYDSFTAKHGLINSIANARAFNADSSYYLLSSLEVLDEDKNLERKSDMFTKRTIKQNRVVTSVDTSSEALAVSIGQKAHVDLDYMESLTGFSQEKILEDLKGVIFLNVGNADDSFKTYVTADEYLSGNIREKLRLAKAAQATMAAMGDNSFDINVAALEKAMPKDLDATEIAVRLGSTWVDKEYVEEFMYELLQTPYYLRNAIQVNFSEITGDWNIAGKSQTRYDDVLANVTYGTSRANAYRIIEDSLNLRDVRIYDTKINEEGKEVRVLNRKETTLAAQRQDAIKQAFKDWIFKDPERRQDLVATYNEKFNSTRTREYDGSHIVFSGMSPEITLKSHQTAAIARILYGGNTLLAHEVGAGKTFEMVGAAMESKRLGLCNKSLLAVPGHLTEQIAGEFLRLYPSANILVATRKDFEPKNRKKFCAKIATGDYDCVIIGHSQLEKIPLSKERQKRLLNEQIRSITDAIKELKRSRGERFNVKQMEKTRNSLEARLLKLNSDKKKDDVVTFEQLGVDRLFVDESHSYKNLFLYTKMRNVAGLSQSEAQKSSDMFMKCRYMDEVTEGKGVIFSTGTPITNSMAELYTVQRYLQYDTLQEMGLIHFDSWASTFGETTTQAELAPEGNSYKMRTRFSQFQNLPELMTIFGEVADIKTADTLDLPRPKANFHTIAVKPSEIQKELVAGLSERAKAVHDKLVDPSDDNMLCITNDGRKIGLDQRLMNDMLPDHPGSKVNVCMENIYRIWDETADKRLTQLCFCDFSTPKKNGKFNVYDDIKNKLLAKGVPENEIAFIHDYHTEAQKKELFAKVRSGKVRILFGSTFKCGAGTNVQDRLVALHDLDCPWRPSDLAQRAGRIVRQGNQNAEVDIYRYVTESTFDAYLFQTIEKKQQFISQIMTSKSPVRSCDDVDEEVLSYAEIKALCAGNPLVKEKMNLDIEVSKLKMLKAEHQSQHYRLQDDLLNSFPKRIEAAKGHIEGFKADMERLETNTHRTEEGISPMVILGKTYTDRSEAGAALMDACWNIKTADSDKIGSYRGFDMYLSVYKFSGEVSCSMKGSMTHSATLGNDISGNITRINNAFYIIPNRLRSSEAQLQTLYEQVENAKAELARPFALEAELIEKSARLSELDAILNTDEATNTARNITEIHSTDMAAKERVPRIIEQSEAVSAKGKPSLLADLEKNAEKSRVMFGGNGNAPKVKETAI